MSDWTNLTEIMRDLSVAQGRRVPACLETVGSTAPPVITVGEETDEEYYNLNGDIDFSKPPDFNLIQEMLSLVRHKNEMSKDDIVPHSELNPLSPVFVPSSESDTAIIKIKRREKNVAISSILKAQGIISPIQMANVPKFHSSMFKKKSTPSKEKIKTTVCTTHSDTATINKGQYVPSALASVYYNKYLANSELKEQIKEDVWSRDEEQIEEIEKKRLIMQNLESSTQHCNGDVSNESGDVSNDGGDVSNGSGDATNDSGDVSYGSSTSSKYGLDIVGLLRHRHQTLDSAADCVVCCVADKHGYSFKEEGD